MSQKMQDASDGDQPEFTMPRHLLILAVSDYLNPQLRLSGTRANVDRVENALKPFGFHPAINLGERRDEVLDKLKAWNKQNKGTDRQVVIYILAHGDVDTDSSHILLMGNHGHAAYGTTTLRVEDLLREIRHCRKQEVLCILDSCFSGRAIAHGIPFANNAWDLDSSLELVATASANQLAGVGVFAEALEEVLNGQPNLPLYAVLVGIAERLQAKGQHLRSARVGAIRPGGFHDPQFGFAAARVQALGRALQTKVFGARPIRFRDITRPGRVVAAAAWLVPLMLLFICMDPGCRLRAHWGTLLLAAISVPLLALVALLFWARWPYDMRSLRIFSFVGLGSGAIGSWYLSFPTPSDDFWGVGHGVELALPILTGLLSGWTFAKSYARFPGWAAYLACILATLGTLLPTALHKQADSPLHPLRLLWVRSTDLRALVVPSESDLRYLHPLDDKRLDLSGAVLAGVDLRGAQLRRADLTSANLTGADLRNAMLNGANLREAGLAGAQLDDGNVSRADLRGACLRKAKLHRATLAESKLAGTDFSSVDLTDVHGLSSDALGVAGGDDDTKLPSDLVLPCTACWPAATPPVPVVRPGSRECRARCGKTDCSIERNETRNP